MLGIGAVSARLANLVRIEVAVHRQRLPPEAAADMEQQILIAIVAVPYYAVGIVSRRRRQKTEAADRSRAGDTEAVLVVAAALGKQVQLRRGAWTARDEIDYAGI